MDGRFGLGPVFVYEWLSTSRRWQVYAARALCGLALLVGLLLVWWNEFGIETATSSARIARVGQAFAYAVVGVQLATVLLIGPAMAAGAVCTDRSSGRLTLMMTTDLSSAEIVLGKLAVRLIPVLGVVASTFPVVALLTLLGGIDPEIMARAFAINLTIAVLACVIALSVSVWASKPHEVLLVTYGALAVWLLACPTASAFVPMPAWAQVVDPIGLMFRDIGSPARRVPWTLVVAFIGLTLAYSALLVVFSISKLRSVAARGVSEAPRASRFRRRPRFRGPALPWFSPAIDVNPVLWRECHRQRPSKLAWWVWVSFAGTSAAFVVVSASLLIANGPSLGPGEMFSILGIGLQVSIGLLLLSLSAATTLSEERARGSLDVLMTTPLTSREILWGKWCGVFRLVVPISLPAMLVTAAAAVQTGELQLIAVSFALIVSYGAAVCSLGLAMSTWIPRLGRAIGATVGIYVLVTAGWFFFLLATVSSEFGAGLAVGSPFYGPIFPLFLAVERPYMQQHLGWAYGSFAFWTILYSGGAVVLFLLTVKTFDRYLGRIQDGAEAERREATRLETVAAPARG